MKRRQFLTNMTAGSLVLAAPGLVLQKVQAAEASNHHWVFVHALGGWDVTNWWDPKGREISTFRGPMNKYSRDDIRSAGRIKYAPISPQVQSTEDYLDKFTQKHFRRMQVINGVDMKTNSHLVGRRIAATGTDSPINPTTAAMIASPFASSQAMAYLSASGHAETQNLVTATGVLQNRQRYNDLANKDRFLSQPMLARLNQNKMAKLQALKLNESSDKTSAIIHQMINSRQSFSGMNDFINRLPKQSGVNFDAEVIAAAIGAGICTSGQFAMKGFDTHRDNDIGQTAMADQFLKSIDHLWDELTRNGVADKTTVVITSDFARTPGYNKNDGKDHWPVTSVVFMGKDVKGNRVIGGTDNQLQSRKIDLATLQFSDQGSVIDAGMIHRSIRDKMGITAGSEIDNLYPIESPSLPIFF